MADDFLAQLLGNQNRSRLLRLFTLNQSEVFTASQAAKRSGIKNLAMQPEIKLLEQLNVIKKAKLSIQIGKGKRKVTAGKQQESAWTFNVDSEHASAVSKFVHEVSPMQYKAVVGALKGSGRISAIILSGSFVGDPSRPADLVLAADSLNENRLDAAIRDLEPKFGWEIRYAVFTTPEFRYRLTVQDKLIRDTLDYPHHVLLDRARLL